MHAFNLNPTTAIAAVAFLSALPTAQASLYLKSSPVTQLDAKNFDRIINKSNHTSVVEFYAPWCGHCQNLKPAYEKAARNLEGLAHVAAVNCDEDENKQLCGMMGVKGFPTLKTVRPGKKGKPIVEDYMGPRTAKGIVDVVIEKINNHVKRVTDKDLDSFLSTKNDTAKAILFTEKGTTSALLKSIAIDFLDVISVAQIRDKEAKANQLFDIKSYPTLVLLPGGDKQSIVYNGEMKKDAMVKFLAQAGEPNPDPAPTKSKGEKKGDKKSEKKNKKASSKSSESSSKTTSTESAESTDVPPAAEKPVEIAPPIPAITEAGKLTKECLNHKAHTCVLAFVPSTHGETAEKALTSLAELAFKHAHAQRHLFPFFEVHTDNEVTTSVFKSLELAGEVDIVAVNGKRGWWRHYEGDFTPESVESWIDAIRLSEGTKKKIPDGVISEAVEETTAEKKPAETVEVEPESESPSKGAEPTPEATKEAPKHEEL
ncbi:thioredoxin-domain-containing protein [Annulohypoxylon bovei var. microspora]|nr:thioredoxin-domain-containing protein [Annulohypoxylon bovei var. microspora]